MQRPASRSPAGSRTAGVTVKNLKLAAKSFMAVGSRGCETESGSGQAGSESPRSRGPAALSSSRRFSSYPRLADLLPQPRRHRHRYHGVFAPNHPLRPAVTALAVGNVGKQRDTATGGHAEAGHAARDCCGDIRLISFITEPGPIRKILTHLGEPLEPPPISPARGPPTDWGELVQVHDDRDVFRGRIDELPAVDIHSL
jgi:hypothetical protein